MMFRLAGSAFILVGALSAFGIIGARR